jgi:hypothetical protein
MISVTNNVRPAIENMVEPITRAGSVFISIFSVNATFIVSFRTTTLFRIIPNKRFSISQLFVAFECRGDRTQPRGYDRLHSPRFRTRANGGLCSTVTLFKGNKNIKE